MTKREKEIYEALKAEFPKEAYSKDTSRGFELTSLKSQYAKERLNEVLGINGWQMNGQYSVLEDKSVLYTGTLVISFVDEGNPRSNDKGIVIHAIEAIGHFQSKKNMGDVYKGAATDAMSKAASSIGLGNEMFKGNINLSTVGDTKSSGKSNNSGKNKWTAEKKDEVANAGSW
jgi:hypothetical protein